MTAHRSEWGGGEAETFSAKIVGAVEIVVAREPDGWVARLGRRAVASRLPNARAAQLAGIRAARQMLAEGRARLDALQRATGGA